MPKTVLAILTVALTALAATSCSDNSCNVKEDEVECPATVEETLNALAEAYEGKDLESYEDLLREDFLFCFTPEIAESLDLPPDNPCWGKAEDLTATGNMFNDPSVTGIVLYYEYVIDWDVCEREQGGEAYTGYCCRLAPDIKVRVERPQQEPLTYWVNDSWLDVMVVPDPEREGCWCVLWIQEWAEPWKTEAAGTAFSKAPSTWSGIKAMWAGD